MITQRKNKLVITRRSLLRAGAAALVIGGSRSWAFPLRGGATPSAALPADALTTLLQGMSAGSWQLAPDTFLSNSCYDKVTGASDYNATMAAQMDNGSFTCTDEVGVYEGGAHDTTSGRAIYWGSGHGGYQSAGDLMAFDFASLKWERIASPDNNANIDPTVIYIQPNGDPFLGIHSYGGSVFIPGLGSVGTLALASTLATSSCTPACSGIYLLDLGFTIGNKCAASGSTGSRFVPCVPTNTPTNAPLQWGALGSTSHWTPAVGTTNNQNTFAYNNSTQACYDPVTNRIFVTSPGNVPTFFWNVGTHVVTVAGGIGMLPGYQTGKIRGNHQEFWLFGQIGVNGSTGINKIDLTNPARTDITPTPGYGPISTAVLNSAYPNVVYHPPSDKFILWVGDPVLVSSLWQCANNADPNTVSIYDPVANTLTDHPAHNGGVQLPCGNFSTDQPYYQGRFYYDTTHNCFIQIIMPDGQAYVYKPDF